MALRGADVDFNSDHAGNDVWICAPIGRRYSAGFRRDTDYRAGTSCGRSRSGRRFNQALAGRWPSAGGCGMAWADEAGARDFVCHDHKYRGVSAVSHADGHDRRIPLQPAGGDDLCVGGIAARLDDVYSVSGLLPAASVEEKRKYDGATRDEWIHRVLLSRRKICDRSSLARVWSVAAFPGGGAVFRAPVENTVFSGGRSVSVFPGRVAAERRPADGDQPLSHPGGRSDTEYSRGLRKRASGQRRETATGVEIVDDV